MRRSRSGPPTWKPPTSSSASSSVVKSMTPTNRPSAASSSIAGPPTPFEWKITLSRPCRASASRIVITALVVLPSIVIATRGRPSSPCSRWPWCSMPAIAAATLSKIVVLIGFSPRMSTTECTTITSRVPTSGPKRRFPDAIGVTMIFGIPIGSDSMALAPSTAPSAPPRAQHAVEPAVAEQVEREPLQAEQHAVHRLAAAAGLAQAPRSSSRRAARPRRATRRARCRAARRGCRSRRRSSTGRAPADDRARTRSPAPSCRGSRSGEQWAREPQMYFRSVLFVSSTSHV